MFCSEYKQSLLILLLLRLKNVENLLEINIPARCKCIEDLLRLKEKGSDALID